MEHTDDNEEFDFESMEEFEIPENFLKTLYDFTGTSDKDRGFCLAYVDQIGQVRLISKAESMVVDLGLRKAIEKYLLDLEEEEASMRYLDGGDDKDDDNS